MDRVRDIESLKNIIKLSDLNRERKSPKSITKLGSDLELDWKKRVLKSRLGEKNKQEKTKKNPTKSMEGEGETSSNPPYPPDTWCLKKMMEREKRTFHCSCKSLSYRSIWIHSQCIMEIENPRVN